MKTCYIWFSSGINIKTVVNNLKRFHQSVSPKSNKLHSCSTVTPNKNKNENENKNFTSTMAFQSKINS